MICPRCETLSMAELERDGVTIDRCDQCRGVWLDRGELEKLIARDRTPPTSRPEAGRIPVPSRPIHEEREGRRHDREDDDDDDRRQHRGKRSWWEIFD